MHHGVGGLPLTLFALLFWLSGAAAQHVLIDVAAVDDRHIASVSARHLAGTARGLDLVLSVSGHSTVCTKASPCLKVLPLHTLRSEVPELDVLRLPFFYPDITAVHRALDGALGARLKAAARVRGWEILDFWDEGMEVMSGNLPYTDARALQGKEFVLLRDDPIAEITLRALDVWSRRTQPNSLAQLHTECVVASRSATLQQIQSEQLARVHLDLTLTRHRYEGWVVAMRRQDWEALDSEARTRLNEHLSAMRTWQRREAAAREESAQRNLVKQAMTVYPLAASTWLIYRAMQPAWERFLADSLSETARAELVTLAASTAGIDLARGRHQALPQAQQSAPQRQ